jgi:hypothetical protein
VLRWDHGDAHVAGRDGSALVDLDKVLDALGSEVSGQLGNADDRDAQPLADRDRIPDVVGVPVRNDDDVPCIDWPLFFRELRVLRPKGR